MTHAVLYTDFNCPFCYALHERLQALDLAEKVEWRGVEHDPTLPAPMRPAEGRQAAELGREVAAIHTLAPEVPITLPAGKPNTEAAIVTAAAALRAEPERAPDFITALYQAFWLDGADLSELAVIARIATDSGLTRRLDLEAARAEVRGWAEAWSESPFPAVPHLIRGDGSAIRGLSDEETLRRFLTAPRSE